MIDILLWFFLLEILSFAAFPLLANALPWLPDSGWGLSKAGGMLFWALLLWFFTSLGITHSSAFWGWLLIAAAIPLSLVFLKNDLRSILRSKEVRAVELTFWFVAIVFLLIRSNIPEIQWGEKPMDFSFLNYFTRLQTLPPQDPWASGQSMHYYYFGYFLVGLLLKLTGISTGVGYNLAVATLPAVLAAGLVSVLLACTGSVRRAVIASLVVVFFADAEVLRLACIKGQTLNSHLFWASTRLFTSPSFFEYPLWTNLFADLHPHMMALPFTILLLGLGIRMLDSEYGSTPGFMLHRLLYSMTWASLVILNAWDFIAYGLLTGIFLVFRPWQSSSSRRGILVELSKRVGEYLGLLAAVILIVLPFIRGGAGHEMPALMWADAGEFNTLAEVLWAHGIWVLPLLVIWIGQFAKNWVSG